MENLNLKRWTSYTASENNEASTPATSIVLIEAIKHGLDFRKYQMYYLKDTLGRATLTMKAFHTNRPRLEGKPCTGLGLHVYPDKPETLCTRLI